MTIRLFCSEYQLDVQDDEVATLEILNRDLFRRILNELKGFDSSEVREINILDGESVIEAKDILVIFDPYEIDVNDKNYISKLHKELENYFKKSDDAIFSLNEMSAYINLHFNNIICGCPLDLTVKSDLTLKEYLKFLDVKVAEEYQSLQDRIVQFISANGVIKFIKVIVFINLKSILSEEDINNVISTAIRTRCPLLLLENTADNRNFPNERKLSVDEDLYDMIK